MRSRFLTVALSTIAGIRSTPIECGCWRSTPTIATPAPCGRRQDRPRPLRRRRPPIPDPAAYTPGRPRPDLQAIELTLPPCGPAQRTFDRPVFAPDGAIVYAKREGDWEPPRDINGYVRDPDNAWRFLPLWLPCGLRHRISRVS